MIVLDQDDGVLGRALNDVKQLSHDGVPNGTMERWGYQNGTMERWGSKWNDRMMGYQNGTMGFPMEQQSSKWNDGMLGFQIERQNGGVPNGTMGFQMD